MNFALSEGCANFIIFLKLLFRIGIDFVLFVYIFQAMVQGIGKFLANWLFSHQTNKNWPLANLGFNFDRKFTFD